MGAETIIDPGDPLAVAVVEAVHGGDAEVLRELLNTHPGLAGARLGTEHESRTLLHVATDWPGHYPNGPEIVRILADSGAAVDGRFVGQHSETPLHWAASSDDVPVLDTLLDAGADIEAPGGVIGGGTPLADAVGFAQWKAARRLVERGARTTLPQAAALGLMDRVVGYFESADHPPAPDEITNGLWYAAHGGQGEAAQYLLEKGADPDWVGHGGRTAFDAAQNSGAKELADWLRSKGARTAAEVT
jgi:ankyrin repeat protein